MDALWFDYEPGPEEPRKAFPDEPVMRPILDVILATPHGPPLPTKLLVDSGSEYTLVTKAFARRLGISRELSSDYAEPIRMGGTTLLAELATVTLTVPSFDPYEATVGFVGNWTFSPPGICGQRGFFDRFGVIFDRMNLRFGIMARERMDDHFGVPLAKGDHGTE